MINKTDSKQVCLP